MGFQVYQNSALFQSSFVTTYEKVEEEVHEQMDASGTERIINSRVLGLSVTEELESSHLEQPIEISLKPLRFANKSMTCVFWDPTENDGQGDWSATGCILFDESPTRDDNGNVVYVCLCEHLTNFALLLNLDKGEIPERQRLALELITYIGCGLSLLGLGLTILAFIFIKSIRIRQRQQTLFNLALSLFCAIIIFLIGVEQTQNKSACIAISAMIHYFLLVAFMWMLVEAYVLYTKIVIVFDDYVEYFIWKACLVSWGELIFRSFNNVVVSNVYFLSN